MRKFILLIAGSAAIALTTWSIAHLFYMRTFVSSQLQVVTSQDAWLHAASPSVTKSERVLDLASGRATYWRLEIEFPAPAGHTAERSARARVDLTEDKRFNGTVDLRGKWIVTAYKLPQKLQGQGNHKNRIQIELYDVNGKVMRGPLLYVLLADQWMPMEFRPYDDAPIPLGHKEAGFDLSQVRHIGIRLRVDQWAHRQKPNFYPAKGELLLAPFIIAQNPLPERAESGIHPPSRMLAPAEDEEFFVGINYPWHNYGWDFGRNPWNPDPNAHAGWSTKKKMLADDFAHFKRQGITVVRIFIFCDLRTGLAYDEKGRLTGFDRFVAGDMEAVLQAARKHGIRLIPTLLNFDLVNGISFDGSGEHQEFVIDKKARTEFLEKAMRPFLAGMTPYQDVIYAVDLMNEPEHALFLTNRENWDHLKTFFIELTALTRETLPETRVTVGCANRQLLAEFWKDFPQDVLQFHFYQQLEDEEQSPYDFPASRLAPDRPVIIGEVEGDDPARRLAQAKKNGYAGILFWSYRAGQDGYSVDLKKVKEWHDKQTR